MKRVIIFLISLLLAFSFYSAFSNYDTRQFNDISTYDQRISKPLNIPQNQSTEKINPEEFLNTLKKLSVKYNANINRTSYFDDNKTSRTTKYVLLNHPQDYFDHFKIKSGTVLNTQTTLETDSYVSTIPSKDTNQIGVIYDFAQNNALYIKTMKTCLNVLPVYGVYYVQTGKAEDYDAFQNELYASLGIDQSQINHNITITNGDPGDVSNSTLQIIQISILVLLLLAVLYYLFNQAKTIGILKLHGISALKICWQISANVLIIFYLIFTLLSITLAVLIDGFSEFLNSLLVGQLPILSSILLLIIISLVYISSIKANTAIKDKRDTEQVFSLNLSVKVIASVLLITLLLGAYNPLAKAFEQQNALKNWTKASQYGMFLGVTDDDNQFTMSQKGYPLAEETYKFFPDFNKAGSLYIDARAFEPTQTTMGGSTESKITETDEEKVYTKYLTVNTNYLQQYPVMDSEEKEIKVAENSKDFILLIPEKYKYLENTILSYFANQRFESLKTASATYNFDVASKWPNNQQNIKIIWAQNNQKVFSFNTKVNPADRNLIQDPVIAVITEQNTTPADLGFGGGSNNPYKFKLTDNDPQKTYNNSLYPAFKDMGIEDNLTRLVSVTESINEELYFANEEITNRLLVAGLLLLCIVLVLIQNASIYFEQNKRKFTVMKFFGTGFIQVYKNLFLLLIGSFILQSIISTVFSRNVPIVVSLIVNLAVLLIEMLVSFVSLTVVERRNIIKVLKGG